jgi:hypothetical protein
VNTAAARRLAQLHLGKVPDASGTETQFMHAERVALRVPETMRPVAYLHDIVEDGFMTYEELARRGLTMRQQYALRLLTRKPDQTYAEYIERIANAQGAAGAEARTIKDADLDDNTTRVCPPEMEGLRRPGGRYDKAKQRLAAAAV